MVVVVVTFVLFVVSIFVKGFTHELLLEAAVLLVSVKLIMMALWNRKTIGSLHDQLNVIIKKIDDQSK